MKLYAWLFVLFAVVGSASAVTLYNTSLTASTTNSTITFSVSTVCSLTSVQNTSVYLEGCTYSFGGHAFTLSSILYSTANSTVDITALGTAAPVTDVCVNNGGALSSLSGFLPTIAIIVGAVLVVGLLVNLSGGGTFNLSLIEGMSVQGVIVLLVLTTLVIVTGVTIVSSMGGC